MSDKHNKMTTKKRERNTAKINCEKTQEKYNLDINI